MIRGVREPRFDCNSGTCKKLQPKREKNYNMRMKVGSWNVRTMLQAGKFAELADEL
jgi:hypothetical protein